LILLVFSEVIPNWAQPISHNIRIAKSTNGFHITTERGAIDLEMIASNILRVDVQPGDRKSPRTLVIDPALKPAAPITRVHFDGSRPATLQSEQMSVSITTSSPMCITVSDSKGHQLLRMERPLIQAASHRAAFLHAPGENLYGMTGLSRRDNGGGLLRMNGSVVTAAPQGQGGAPWFFTTRYGVLIDSDGGTFDTRDNSIEFSGASRDDMEYFVMTGPPMKVMAALATLTGRPPLPPKWSLGFLNGQWGSTEAELKSIAATYRTKHIPMDAFILDFDWKAWGEDNYGEWRWNSTSAPGNVSPDKFPDGADGIFAKDLRSQGIKLVGILKPRILLYKAGSSTEMQQAAAYADAHQLWYPREPKIVDYFTGRPGRDLDFSKADTRSWYWKHLEPSFDAGLVGWWNDEADVTQSADGHSFLFNNFQFLNMGRTLYEGQRRHSNLRVWSLNRTFYLGAQRYGYAEWSGDIQTGFQSMAHQQMRMLATLDLGEPHWSMDTGGFFGHPTDENYARWSEFSAFVPIDRVHGDHGEKRQPWVYGPTAEAAATKAIRLRYELLPYIYSFERTATESGVGLVRPLFWMFPNDQHVANDGSAWMFGDALLVSPVVKAGEHIHSVYLPAGTWYDYFRGTTIHGGQTIRYQVNSKTWQDIPLFVREGSILASQPSQDYVDQHRVSEVTLDIFPGPKPAQFIYYDDDGETYSYEQGVYYRQTIRASKDTKTVQLELGEPSGTYRPPLRSYIIRIHKLSGKAVILNGATLSMVPSSSSTAALKEGQWKADRDRFGPVTIICVHAYQQSHIIVH
jgi:alpha-glucosidase (family GH31 glycosyl hydrolase)